MKTVFMGTPDFAVGALEALIKAGHEVKLVVTQPDKPKGRGKEVSESPVKICAEKYGIPTFQPVKIREEESVRFLKTIDADVFVVAAFGQILTADILNMPKYGCINIHASILPKYRGAAPIQWVILNGEEKAGVTIMQMDEGLDTGDMLLSDELEISKDETGDSLHDKLSVMGAELIVKALKLLEEGKLTATPQPEGPLFYAKMLKKEMGNLNYAEDAVTLERWIRGLYSWPGAYTFYHGRMLKILKAEVADTDSAGSEGHTGEIIEVGKDFVTVQCGKGSIRIKEVKPQGKKEMSVHDFLLGNKIQAGDFFSASEER
ncbi:MAG: methionyl-tRNA formyltransferase [Lachnospiraceae bacterium]|nr:methionyl-tRNA formyltransferase [Lachnospiraceae bacterium]